MVLLDILPRAIAWADAQSQLALRAGRPLDARQCRVAVAVGVCHPEHVRILEAGAIPLPADPSLRQAAGQLGLLAACRTKPAPMG